MIFSYKYAVWLAVDLKVWDDSSAKNLHRCIYWVK